MRKTWLVSVGCVLASIGACAEAPRVPPKAAPSVASAPSSSSAPVVASASSSVPSVSLLPVPGAKVVTINDPSLRARVLSAASGDAFPWKPAPSLSGGLRGLAFGMTGDEARAAAPGFAAAFKEGKTSAKWLPLGPAKARVRIEDFGVDMIELDYPSEAIARSTLEAAWGKPRDGDSAFNWKVWTNAEHSIRATLMRGDGQQLTRLELLPYRPLAELIADGGELAWNGKHVLDCTAAELAPAMKGKVGDDLQLLPTELSSGHLPMRVVEDKGAIARYTLGIDFTYDRPVRETIRAALEKHFGAGTKDKDCMDFPPTKAGVRARACVVYSQWQITIERATINPW
ncbi:MAG: hypothetical protein ACXVEF_29465 [Polyangiales bacterium]